MEEAFAAGAGSKGKKIFIMILLLLLIWFNIYFLVMWFTYTAPAYVEETEETTQGEPVEYERYSNPHKITTTPDYPIADAKDYLKQVLHDKYRDLGYKSDPSSGAINYTSNIINVNNTDCYVFNASGKTFAVSVKLSAAYVKSGNDYIPLTFEDTDYLFE